MIRPAIIATTALAATVASAATPVGNWTGKLHMKLPSLPTNAPPAQKQMFAAIKAAKFILNLKADKTYSGKTIGLPGPQPPTETGTWSQSGRTVTLLPKTGGKGAQKLTMSADGKTMILQLPGGRGQAIFSR